MGRKVLWLAAKTVVVPYKPHALPPIWLGKTSDYDQSFLSLADRQLEIRCKTTPNHYSQSLHLPPVLFTLSHQAGYNRTLTIITNCTQLHGGFKVYLVSLSSLGVSDMRYPELEGALQITSAINSKLKSEAGWYSPFLKIPKVESS